MIEINVRDNKSPQKHKIVLNLSASTRLSSSTNSTVSSRVFCQIYLRRELFSGTNWSFLNCLRAAIKLYWVILANMSVSVSAFFSTKAVAGFEF